MLKKYDPDFGQMKLWMTFWPEDPFKTDPELHKIASILDNPEILAPFVNRYNQAAAEVGLQRTGRNTIPIRTFAGMMVLKYLHELSYRELSSAVKDRFSWRIFCRIPFDKKVPDYSTLCKLVQRFGPETVEEMNRAVLKDLANKNKLKGKKVKVDTTVIESDIEHPTDAGLLREAVKKITRLVERCRDAGVDVKDFVNHGRAIRKLFLSITKVTRRRGTDVIKEVDRISAKIAVLAEDTLARAKQVVGSAKTMLAKGLKGLHHKVVNELAHTCGFLHKVLAQTWRVVSGDRNIPDRLVSIHDPGARPIRKGKAGKPVEFGRKVVLHSNEQHLITGYQVYDGNPNDEKLFMPAIRQFKRNTGFTPAEAAGDRGMYSAENERLALKAGLKRVALPKRGKKSAARQAFEKQAWFKRLCRWRAGQEAEISLLKRKRGLRRSLSRGTRGTKTWVGWSVLAHNLTVAAKLI